MDKQNRATDLEELLQHASWVKNLAFASLRDHALAEDVSQEVLLKAIGEPQRSGRVLRAWLAAVTRNMARNEIRGLMRRRARERKVADRNIHGTDGDLDQTDLMHAHRELTYVVESLSPKHREVIVQRFFEEQSFKGISQRLGISEGNVRIRLHRALEELRQQMQQRSGDWRASCLLLTPTAALPCLPLALPTTSARFAVAAVVVLVSATAWWKFQPSIENQPNPDPSNSPIVANDSVSKEGSAGTAQAMESIHLERESLADQSEFALESREQIGLVLWNGYPVAGAQVVIGQPDQIKRTTTALDGTYSARLDLTSYGVISVFSAGRYGTAYLQEGGRFPDVIRLYEVREKAETIRVLDSATKQGIPGARVQLFVNWAGSWEGARFNTIEPEFLGEYITDSEGHFPYPDGVPPGLLEIRASASGYVHGVGSGTKVYLHSGQELPVQLLQMDGSPLANVEVILGPIPRVQRTNADGFTPIILDWEKVAPKGEPLLIPKNLSVRCPDGRLWTTIRDSLPTENFKIYNGVLQITVGGPPIQVELKSIPLSDGSYVEVRTESRFGWWNPLWGAPNWQRFEIGETSPLLHGWIFDEFVTARVMPEDISLGSFPVIDGKAIISPQLIPFRVTLTGPSVTEGKALFLVASEGEDTVHIPFVDGVAEANVMIKDLYTCWIRGANTDESLFVVNAEKESLTIFYLEPIDGRVEAVIKEQPRRTHPVLIRVNGTPVLGGKFSRRLVDRFGVGEMFFDEQDRPLLSQVELLLPGEIVHQLGGPTLTGFSFQDDSEIPGVISHLVNGDRVWDMELASVELWIPATDSAERRQFTITKGAVTTILLDPNPGAYSNMMFVPPEGGWYAFRLPAATYTFQVGHLTYGGDGMNLLGGKLTQLQPDSGE